MNALIQVKNVTKKYGGLIANNNINFDVAENEILSVIGPNGAGKSTLFKMISSFTPTTSGEVLYRGQRISNLKPHIVARKGIVRTFQETTIFKSMTVRESVIVAQHLRAKASLTGYFWGSKTAKEDLIAFGKYADELLEFLGMSEISSELSSNLPQGNLRALGVAVGLATDPKVLLLDEPFAGVDPISVNDIKDIIRHLRDRGIGVLITDHNVRETLDICETAFIVGEGHIIASGGAQDILGNARVRQIYLGEQFRL